MASLIANCLARLVKEGRVSPKQAKDAQALHDGMQGRLGDEMGPASAEAVAALQAAKVMGEQARLRKVSIAKSAIAYRSAADRMNAHPRGKVAGLQALLTRDIFETGTGVSNVDAKTEVIFGKLDGMFGPGNEALGSKFAGLRQDKALARSVTRENFGEDTGEQTAKQISKGWKAVTDYAANRAKLAGKMFSLNEDWRQPQFWDASRVKGKGEAVFTADVVDAMQRGGVQVFDKGTGAPVSPLKLPAVLKNAYTDITTGGGRGGGGMAFSPEMRVFRFADGKPGADAYLSLMEKYGPGSDLYSMMRSHLQSASRDIALVEQLGPQYQATFRALHADALASEKAGSTKFIPILSSARGAEKTFDVLTGKSSAVANETLAGIMGGARAWLSAVQLGSATVSSIPGDSATMALAAHYNGIPAAKVIASALKGMVADSAADRAIAARLGIISAAASDTALTQARFADQWLDPRLSGKVANTVIRLSGLQAWTESAKRAVTMEMMGWIADNAPRAYKAVDLPFQRFLDRHGVTPAEWDTLRSAPLLEAGGAKFFDASSVADQALSDKLMSAIIDERHFFILEPTALERAAIMPAAPKGTVTGEIGRSFGMYKTFSASMVTTHMLRAAMQRDLTSKAGYALALAGYTTVLGALAVGAKDVVAGKDPRRMVDVTSPMNTAKFWVQAALQGGGLGVLGDLVNQGFTRADTSLAGTLGGPLFSAVDAGSKLIFPPVNKLIEGKDATFGTALARTMRSYLVPNLFYTKLAVDRLFFDEVQRLIDPKYQASFRNAVQNAQTSNAQKFWWAPGTTAPQRAPNVGNVIQ